MEKLLFDGYMIRKKSDHSLVIWRTMGAKNRKVFFDKDEAIEICAKDEEVIRVLVRQYY